MYPTFEKEALAEGEKAVATAFKEIGEVEEKREERDKKLADRLEAGTSSPTTPRPSGNA